MCSKKSHPPFSNFRSALLCIPAAPDCDSGEFTCSEYKFNHTSCIAPHWRCDKEPDCPDKSDEANCSKWKQLTLRIVGRNKDA